MNLEIFVNCGSVKINVESWLFGSCLLRTRRGEAAGAESLLLSHNICYQSIRVVWAPYRSLAAAGPTSPYLLSVATTDKASPPAQRSYRLLRLCRCPDRTNYCVVFFCNFPMPRTIPGQSDMAVDWLWLRSREHGHVNRNMFTLRSS